MSKEFFWCGKLTKSQPEITISVTPESIPADSDSFRTAVILKHAILGPVESQDLNVIELCGKGFHDDPLSSVIACLQSTETRPFDQTLLDITLTDESKLKLVKGDGPISIVGQFVLQFMGPTDNIVGDDDDDDDECEEEEEDLDEEEDLETPSPVPAPKKRKQSEKQSKPLDPKAKKMKSENLDSDDESKSKNKGGKAVTKGTSKRGRKS